MNRPLAPAPSPPAPLPPAQDKQKLQRLPDKENCKSNVRFRNEAPENALQGKRIAICPHRRIFALPYRLSFLPCRRIFVLHCWQYFLHQQRSFNTFPMSLLISVLDFVFFPPRPRATYDPSAGATHRGNLKTTKG